MTSKNTKSTGVKNTKSSEVLKQEVLTQIDKIDTDIDEMSTRLSPGQFIDDLIFYPRGANAATTFDLLKNNPMGTTFLTLGTLLLMEDENHTTYEHIARNRMTGMVGDVKSGIGDVKDRFASKKQDAMRMMDSVSSKVSGLKEKVVGGKSVQGEEIVAQDGSSIDFSEVNDADRARLIDDAQAAFAKKSIMSKESLEGSIDKVKGVVSEKLSGVQGKVQETLSGIKEKLPSQEVVNTEVNTLYGEAQTKTSDLMASASEKVSEVSESIKSSISEKADQGVQAVKGIDPLTYMAVGAGLGTLTGLSLPLMDAEVGLVDGKLDQTLSTFTQDLQAALDESAGILKDLVLSDLKSFNVGMFKR